MKFPYFKLPNPDPRKKSFEFPWIPVSINAKDDKKSFLTLVDSGADSCILDKDVADFLGLDILNGEHFKTHGIGGNADVYYFSNIYINIGGIEVKTKCGFIDGYLMEGRIAGVLGRQGFFDHFKVCIDEKSKEIDLKPR